MEPEENNSEALFNYVKSQWEYIDRQAYEGHPHAHLILAIDDLLNSEREAIVHAAKESGKGPDFSDLNRLIEHSNHRRSWLNRTIDLRKDYIGWWNDLLTTHYGLLVREASESRKLVLFVHGAALIASMTALGTVQNISYTSSFLAVAGGALVGFILAVLGQIVWLECYGSVIATLRADFRPTQRMRRLRSYGKYMRRRWKKEVRWSFILTYASVISFPIYSALALSLAIHN